MRLHDFISENMEVILQKWEDFARDVWPDNCPDIRDLRDHAEEMLLAIVKDMKSYQTEVQRQDKSVGKGSPSTASEEVDSSSKRHAKSRAESGFDICTLVAEYRALRSSVLHLWRQTLPDMAPRQIEDMTRFNECVDQLLAESVVGFTECVEHSRGLLLGILGHDLRSPLCAVSMMAGLLEENKDLSDSARRMASQIVVASREMTRLVADLLDYAGSGLGVTMQVTRQSMSLEELCREVIEEIGAAHSSHIFELETCGDVNGEWDRARLRQLLSNLLVNAVQHGDEQTPIRLFIRTNGHEVALGVCNHGPPIPPAWQTLMFDPLRRHLDDGLSGMLGGLGLGLYIAREVALAHGGVIEVSSDDRETAFIVKMPQRDRCQNNRTNGFEAPADRPCRPAGRGHALQSSPPERKGGRSM